MTGTPPTGETQHASGFRPIVFHDYGGHAFTAQIARHLANLGLSTLYVSAAGFETPKGCATRQSTDPQTFRAEQLDIGKPLEKDNLLKRFRQQRQYARRAAAWIVRERPSIVVSSNCPIEVQRALLKACRTVGAKFVFWMQDIHSVAIERILSRRHWLLGRAAGAYYRRLESNVLASSDLVVTITDDFINHVGSAGWGLDTRHFQTIENWAPLDDLPIAPRDNPVTAGSYRPNRQAIVYAGTLARKHNPDLLVALARQVDADVHLFSQGSAADHTAAEGKRLALGNLFVHPWVTAADLPYVFAGADILCAFIEPDAAQFSVPSKVLAYLAAGRPILAAIPAGNLAARTIRKARAGLVAQDADDFISNAQTLLADPELCRSMGRSGRHYAERTFNIDLIAERFIACFEDLRAVPALALTTAHPLSVSPLHAAHPRRDAAPTVFHSRSPKRDRQTDMARQAAIVAAIDQQRTDAQTERDGLARRMAAAYASAAALLDESADYGNRASADEQEISEFEASAQAARTRIEVLDAQILAFEQLRRVALASDD